MIRRSVIARNIGRKARDAKAPVPDGHKRCRFCEAVKPLDASHLIRSQKGAWPYYACRECTKQLQKEAYQRRRQRAASKPPPKTTDN